MFKSISFGSAGSKHLFLVILLASAMLLPIIARGKTATIQTPLGDIEIELLETEAPNTVANFLQYIESNRYDKTFIHRSARKADNSGFVIQGGGFTFIDELVDSVATFPPVDNEFGVSNTRGTVAMAKIGGQPDSATSQWFINLSDNSTILDGQNGGFTVFARVIGDGMAVADAINDLPTVDADGSTGLTFDTVPVINFSGDTILEENLVMTAVSAESEPAAFVMNPGLNDAWFNRSTSGQGFFITVFPDLNAVSLAWFTYDTELPPEDASANLGDPGHRWMTAVGAITGNSAVLDIEFASGGLFDTSSGIERTEPGSVGTITLTFEDCNTGLVEYDIATIGQQGSIPIERVATDNIVLCEALSAD
jgi:cyclophilin family peptidyl-prolyl cis-trans isomerase